MTENNTKFKYIIRGLLVIVTVALISFITFCKAGFLFSKNYDVITVSTKSKKFDPKRYAASVATINNISKETTVAKTTTTLAPSTTTVTTKNVITTTAFSWNGEVLSKSKGVVIGPSGKETYYNLNMSGVVSSMRSNGYNEQDYPYWIREDGVKMLGQYVMVAANYSIRPKGTIIESSLGYAIVCDTGSFVNTNATQIDIAVNW